MKINKENIEEWMFKYHEGVLNEADKKQVLAYISMEEHLMEEFRLWSITRLAVNPNIEYPDLSQKLFKKDPFYQTMAFKSIVYFLLGAMLTGAICWWFWNVNDEPIHKISIIKAEIAPQEFNRQVHHNILDKQDRDSSNVSPQRIVHNIQKRTQSIRSKQGDSLAPLDERWTEEPVYLEAIPLQDSNIRQAFDQRQLTYPHRRMNSKVNRLEKPSKKRRINLKRQWKFKEEEADF